MEGDIHRSIPGMVSFIDIDRTSRYQYQEGAIVAASHASRQLV
jgi:hypothetical protein